MQRRPETAYSINRYGIIPNSSKDVATSKPHTVLEQRKFSNQMTICYVSPRRQTLIKSTEIKIKKEIYEWIQNYHPNGIEILSKIALQTRSNYKALINKALSDLRIVEKRANIMDKKDLEEKSKNSSKVENQIAEYEKKLQKINNENQRLRNELNSSRLLYDSMEDDIKQLQSVIKNVKSKLSSNTEDFDYEEEEEEKNINQNSMHATNEKESEKENKNRGKDDVAKAIDHNIQSTNFQIEELKEEEKRLEQELIKLETKLMELTLEERSLLCGQFLPPPSVINLNET